MRHFLSCVLLLTLSACGFRPLYDNGRTSTSSHGGSEYELSQIRVDTIADRQGQILRNHLIDRLQGEGTPPDPVYNLVITYTETQTNLGLSNDAVTTRGQLTLTVNYTLKDVKTGETKSTASVQEITQYNVQTSEFATILSRDDAEDRALNAAADVIQTRLAFYLRTLRTKPDAKSIQAPTETPPLPPSEPLPTGVPGYGGAGEVPSAGG